MITNDVTLQEAEPAADALVRTAFPEPDYQDAFRASIPSGRFSNIDHFVKVFFLAQPGWLRTISMGVPSRAKLEKVIQQKGFRPGEKIGGWRIYDRNQNEIIFGESMGFMEYRFSLRLSEAAGSVIIEASTVVSINSAVGRFYFSLVRLAHKPFVRKALTNALR